jgi:C4-dicarboxylate-specific signal transduction histidine kinase
VQIVMDRPDEEIAIIDRQTHKLSRLVNDVIELEHLTATVHDEGSVALSVKDDGHGMSADCLERLFESFERAPPRPR